MHTHAHTHTHTHMKINSEHTHTHACCASPPRTCTHAHTFKRRISEVCLSHAQPRSEPLVPLRAATRLAAHRTSVALTPVLCRCAEGFYKMYHGEALATPDRLQCPVHCGTHTVRVGKCSTHWHHPEPRPPPSPLPPMTGAREAARHPAFPLWLPHPLSMGTHWCDCLHLPH